MKTILITSRSALLRMRNVSDKSCKGNQNTQFMLNAIYEIMWKAFVGQGKSQMKT
jgi:hypothetical protein